MVGWLVSGNKDPRRCQVKVLAVKRWSAKTFFRGLFTLYSFGPLRRREKMDPVLFWTDSSSLLLSTGTERTQAGS